MSKANAMPGMILSDSLSSTSMNTLPLRTNHVPTWLGFFLATYSARGGQKLQCSSAFSSIYAACSGSSAMEIAQDPTKEEDSVSCRFVREFPDTCSGFFGGRSAQLLTARSANRSTEAQRRIGILRSGMSGAGARTSKCKQRGSTGVHSTALLSPRV